MDSQKWLTVSDAAKVFQVFSNNNQKVDSRGTDPRRSRCVEGLPDRHVRRRCVLEPHEEGHIAVSPGDAAGCRSTLGREAEAGWQMSATKLQLIPDISNLSNEELGARIESLASGICRNLADSSLWSAKRGADSN